MLKVAVLASGNGTNLQALLDRVHRRDGIEVVAVASDKPAARALQRARDAGVPDAVFGLDGDQNREARDLAMGTWLLEQGAELVVLAGYMQLLSDAFLRRFPAAVINVHPALLPAFPGLDAVGQALDYGVKVFGVTVHYVDGGIDTGPVIMQRAVELPDARERDQVFDVLHAIEHELLAGAVRLIAAGEVSIDPANPRFVRLGGRVGTAIVQQPTPASTLQGATSGEVQVARALLSVSDKTGVVEFARGLSELGVELVSTGGTAGELAAAGLPVRTVSDLTGFPEIMDGRVKTLHPKLYAGLLAVRDQPAHVEAAQAHGVEPVDLVCVNLYPFERTAADARGQRRRGDREHRHRRPDDDPRSRQELPPSRPRSSRRRATTRCSTSCAPPTGGCRCRRGRAWRRRRSPTPPAMTRRSRAGSRRSDEDFPPLMVRAFERQLELPYGENPHQRAAYYTQIGRARMCSRRSRSSAARSSRSTTCSTSTLRGSCWRSSSVPACVIVKHNNPCGVAVGATLEAYQRAFACDPVSAFGGVIVLNRRVDRATAEALVGQFVEVSWPAALMTTRSDALEQAEHADHR